jgi:heat-inducible transcriptional repressor
VTAKPKRISPKSRDREERSRAVLFALIETYIATGRPVGSASLQRAGFEELSSATIRNYLAAFEAEGLLDQQHSSAGRVPTARAFQIYAYDQLQSPTFSQEAQSHLERLVQPASKEVGAYLQECTARISDASKCACFCMAPRFDQDMVVRIRLLGIDSRRVLAVLVTDFGHIYPEIMSLDRTFSAQELSAIQSLLQARLEGPPPDYSCSSDWDRIVERIYTELLMRHMTRYTSMWQDDLFRCGIAQLLSYPELGHAEALSPAVALLEHPKMLAALCQQAMSENLLSTWIGEELPLQSEQPLDCAVIIAPYCIRGLPVGAIGCMGPLRLPYGELAGLLQAAADLMSGHLTRSLYQFKLSYRQSSSSRVAIEGVQGSDTIGRSSELLLEDHRYFENRDDPF